MRYVAMASAAIFLISCNRDPNYLKQKYLQSGNKYFDAGRFKEASIMYRKAIEADRKFGPAYYHLALTTLRTGQVPNAVPALRRAVELLKPGTAEANDADLKLAEIMVVAAQSQQNSGPIVTEVQQIVDGLLKRNPSSWEGHKLSGDLAMVEATRLYRANQAVDAKQQVESAVAEYRKAISVKPGDPVIMLALGRTLVVDGAMGEAEAIFKSMIDKDRNNLNGYYELYRVYLAQKRVPDAEAVLKTAIRNNPKDALPRLTLAQFYFRTSKRPELVALFSEMKSDLKKFPDAYLQSGDFFLRVGSFDEAIEQYEEGIRKDPSRRNTYLKHEVEVYVRQSKPNLAYDRNEQILRNNNKDPEARGLKATFLLDKGEVNAALTELQSVVTAKPGNFVARFNLGRAHFARGEYEQARQDFDAAVRLRPDYIPARLAQTQVAMIRGDNDAALHAADDILRIVPGSVPGTIMKAAALQKLGRMNEARSLLDAILRQQPKQVETLLQMGVLDLSEKKNKDAIEVFHRAWEADPNNMRGLLGESKAWLLDGQPEKSVQLIEAEVVKNPNRNDLMRELGNSEVAAGQFDKAIATFQALTAKVSDRRQQVDLWTRIGEAYLRKGDVQQSINSLEKAHQGEPANPAITTNIALLYEMESRKDVARKYYEMSIKSDPNNPDPLALNNLAYLIVETNGDLDQALTYATRAKQRLPKHPEVNDTLGWIYLKKNLTDNALDTFRNLVTEAPQNPIYHYHYAMALLQKGDREKAKKECQSALASKPTKEQEAEIHQLIAKLG
jgi:tetratricopeptide (TPR) repeat protein